MAEAAAKLRKPGFDPAAEVVTEDFDMIAVPGAASVRVVDEARQKVVLETLCDHDSFLVTSEAHYPGWKVKLDGRPHPIYYSNAAFRGTPVPAGSHRIEMVFEPTSVLIGVLLSLAGLTICAATLIPVRSKTLRSHPCSH
jgi:uncharacterized membrane protein YfhO